MHTNNMNRMVQTTTTRQIRSLSNRPCVSAIAAPPHTSAPSTNTSHLWRLPSSSTRRTVHTTAGSISGSANASGSAISTTTTTTTMATTPSLIKLSSSSFSSSSSSSWLSSPLPTIMTTTITEAATPARLWQTTSGIGTDVEMIAANDRLNKPAAVIAAATTTTSRTTTTATTPPAITAKATARTFATHAIPESIASAETTTINNHNTEELDESTISVSPSSTATTIVNDAMKDEYGVMDDAGETYTYPGDFILENGQCLPQAQLRYQAYGTLNAQRDNVLVVCHALTGNASLHSWWGELLGPKLPFDTNQYFVVCCNILGSCYGSTGPRSTNPRTLQPYGKDFPNVSVQDTVRLQLHMLQNHLQVESCRAVIGGSFGGMQALEFAVQAGACRNTTSTTTNKFFTDTKGKPFVKAVVPIACGIRHTAWQIAISEVQRQAIYRDPAWDTDTPEKATAGLEVARQLGMISYRTPHGYESKFGREIKLDTTIDANKQQYGSQAHWQVKSYLEYQGRKFLSRFDPVTYVKMTEQMDSHDVARGRNGTVQEVLGSVQIPALVMGIDSDILYPLQEQEEMARLLPRSEFRIIHSVEGHDGFLLEQEQVGAHIIEFLDRHAW